MLVGQCPRQQASVARVVARCNGNPRREYAVLSRRDDGLVLMMKELHDRLDAALGDAYDWPADLTDDDMVEPAAEHLPDQETRVEAARSSAARLSRSNSFGQLSDISTPASDCLPQSLYNDFNRQRPIRRARRTDNNRRVERSRCIRRQFP
jgi:hypothetical protein